MYRTEHRPPREPMGHARDAATGAVLEVANGIASRIAFPCYYMYREDGLPVPVDRVPPMVRDYRGWPAPDRRDRSWQPFRMHDITIEPIMLDEEGYDAAEMCLHEAPSGLSCEATIDGSVVRLVVRPMCPDADTEVVEVPFSLYVSGTLQDGFEARDMVTRGTLRILPAQHA